MAEPCVYTVILNTNRCEDTLACLQSLHEDRYSNNHILVLDNQSTDGSVEAIAGAFPRVEVVHLEENLGYAGNNNVGILIAMERGAHWVFVLNEDTVLHPGCIADMIAVGESDPRIGIVGPLVYHFDEPNVIQSAGGELTRRWEARHYGQNEPDRGQFSAIADVDWISGCAIMVRRAVIAETGMLDPHFFYYWEEVDWCIRASGRGWRIVRVPSAMLWHKGVRRHYEPSPTISYYNTRNRLLIMRKNGASAAAWCVVSAQMARTLASMSIRPRWRPKRAHRNAMWAGSIDFVRSRWGKRLV